MLTAYARALWLILLGALAVAAVIASTYGIDNLPMAKTFDTDDSRIIELAQTHLKERSLDPHDFFYYGAAYDSVGYFVLRVLEEMGWKADIRLIGMVMRLLCLVFGLATAAALVWLSTLAGLPAFLAFTVSAVFLTTPEFVLYLRTAHPDTMQTFLLVMALAVAFRFPHPAGALASVALAGLAFSTKYSGIYMLPFCLMPAAARLASEETRPVSATVMRMGLLGVAAVALFAAVFVATNPYAPPNVSSFLRQLGVLQEYSVTGHGRLEPADPSLWLAPLTGQYTGTGLIVIALGVTSACAGLAADAFRRKVDELLRDPAFVQRLILVAYVLLGLVHLATVRARFPRYTFHLAPFALVLAALGWQDLVRLVTTRRGALISLATLCAACCCYQAWHGIARMGEVTFKPDSPRIKAGEWLAENFPAKTKVLHEWYSYIPPKFAETQSTWDMSQMQAFGPDLIVINRWVTGRWIWKAPGTRMRDRKFVKDVSYGERADYQERWLLSVLPDWEAIYDTDDIVVLKRKP